MLICRVIGSAVATVKDDRLRGLKLLVVQEVSPDGRAGGVPFVAADTVGAGDGELVLVSAGSGARETGATRETCIDAAITGILDNVEVNGTAAYEKGRVGVEGRGVTSHG